MSLGTGELTFPKAPSQSLRGSVFCSFVERIFAYSFFFLSCVAVFEGIDTKETF